MNDRVVEIVDRAAGTFDSELLTDMSLLCRRTVLGYLDPDEQLQYLFVNRNKGLRAYDLKHPDVSDDFTTNGKAEKNPEGNRAAVMAITSERVQYLIGQSNEDLRFNVALGDIRAVRRETNHGLVDIAIRDSKLKFLFTPQPPQDVDEAVTYIGCQVRSSAPETTATGPTYKYSVESRGSDPDSGPDLGSDSESGHSTGTSRQDSDGRTDPGSNGENEQSAEDWDWIENEAAEDDTSGSDSARTQRIEEADSETTTGATRSGGTGTRPGLTSATKRSEGHDTASEDGDRRTEKTAPEPPSVVTSHIEASQEAFAGIRSPYEDPDAAYSAAVEAYGELCRALQALPSDDFDEYEARLESRLVELESLIELLDGYGPTLTAARNLVERSAGQEDEPTLEDGYTREALVGELAELKSAAAELTVGTEPIERLHAELTEPEDSRATDKEAEPRDAPVSQPNSCPDDSFREPSEDAQPAESAPDETGGSPPEGSSSEIDGDSTVSQSPATAALTRPERVAHHVFIHPDAPITSETRELLYDLAETLDEFDIRSANLNDASDLLSTLERQIDAVDAAEGVETKYLDHVRQRVEEHRGTVDQLLDVLIETRRRVRIGAGEHTSIPHQELVELRERLSEGSELSDRLNRDSMRLYLLLDEVNELIEAAERDTADSPEGHRPSTSGTVEPSPSALVDQSTDVRANEVSEWYDAVRNLAQVTGAIKDGVGDVDAPMRDWCEAVGQFVSNGRDQHPSYGELQMEHNEFSMSDYRDVYGNGERTTEFHFVEVEPLTKTVRAILRRVSAQSMDEVYLPVAPDSKVRLPVIVETPEEFERAVRLLEEFPTSLVPATPVEDEATDDSSSGGGTEDSPKTEAGTGTTDESTGDTDESDYDKERGTTSGGGDSPLTDLGGVTPQVAEALQSAGITSREQLISTDMDELAGIEGVGKAIAQRIKMQVG